MPAQRRRVDHVTSAAAKAYPPCRRPATNGSADRSRGWRIRRWSGGADASPPTFLFRTSCTCGSSARNHAHGKIVSIDTSAARALPGVIAVWTAADIADVPPIDFREGRIPALEPYRQPVLATEQVRYVGEPVAAVFADDPYIAEDAADLVAIEIEELPVLLAADARAGRILARPQHRSRRDPPGLWRRRRGVALRARSSSSSNLPSAAIPACRSKRAARSAATTRRATSSSCTAPPRCRTATASCSRACSSCRPSSIHVHEVACGRRLRHPRRALSGGRSGLRRCDAAWPAGEMDRGPARASRSPPIIRASSFTTFAPRSITRAASSPSTTVYFHDQGAYVRTHAARVVHMTAGILPGPYRVPAYRAVGHFRLTNKTPAATYRAPGRYETTFVRERLIDADRDAGSASTRTRCARRNAICSDEMPYHRPLEALGRGDRARFRRLCRAARQAPRRARLGQAQGRAGAPPRRRRSGRRRLCDVRREERPRSGRRRAHRGRHFRHGRADHRRRLARPGLRDGDGAGLRRDARRRLPARARHPRPDRPDRLRHRRARLARDRDDRLGHAQCARSSCARRRSTWRPS